MARLGRGELVAGRFEIEEVAGAGGMGTVYRARDQLQNEWVALKVLHSNLSGQQAARRFVREAQLLVELRHPGIVRQVAHGIAEHDQPYLAMEWLTGESLRQRLSRGGLSLADSITLLRQVARALAVPHARGIIHRDLKPSNVFLRGCDLSRATLIDFGVARRTVSSVALTLTGNLVGTPEYMAPEQARGDRTLTPACDIFALGCIFYECLTGTPPFVAECLTAVLAKLLFEQLRRIRELRPELPTVIDELVHGMLAKEATDRPLDAMSLLSLLEGVSSLDAPALAASLLPAGGGLDSDQGLVSVLLTTPAIERSERDEHTVDQGAAELERSLRRHAQRELAQCGARVAELADGSLVATFATDRQAATDLVRRATRSALLLRSCWPSASVAVATGRGAMEGRLPLGDAFERAAALLRTATLATSQLLLDDVTAGLLDPRFRTRRTSTGLIALDSVEPDVDETRLLLGKATPCIGRDVELAALEGWLATAIQDSRSRVVLVTAPAGVGKSRLRHEFLRRIAARGEPLTVLLGRGDPLLSRSSYSLFGQAVRELCAVHEDEQLEVRRQKLQARLASHGGSSDTVRVAEFLGEICGIPFSEEGNAKLRAARQDPQLMDDRISAAVLTFLRAECVATPLLLVLEDLHFSDAPTLRLIELMMTELEDLPLMVLALSRPEVGMPHKELWAQRALPLPLHPLSKRASARLVQQAMGTTAPQPLIDRIVGQASGNALYLEELIRAAAAGIKDDAPPTVLAMLQARISGLDGDARRVVRAASVFGETFWQGGVRSLLGPDPGSAEADAQLEALVAAEIIESRRESRFAGEKEFRFRHGLMRDAAYALLTVQERRCCHLVGLSYLERIGETDPALLCEHALRTEDPSHFLPYVLRAVQQAYERCDMEAAERLSELALQAGVDGADRGILLATQAWVAASRQQNERTFELGREALAYLQEGSARWYVIIRYLLALSRITGRRDILPDMLERFDRVEPSADAIAIYAIGVAPATSIHVFLGNREAARKIVQNSERLVEQVRPDDLLARGFLNFSRSLAMRLEPTPFRALACAEEAAVAIAKVGHRHYRHQTQHQWAASLIAVGRYQPALAMLRESRAEAQRFGEPVYATLAALTTIIGLSEMETAPAAAEAVALREALPSSGESPAALVHAAEPYVALALAQLGRVAEAERVARTAITALQSAPVLRMTAYTALAEILLRQGLAVEAQTTTAEGLARLGSLAGCCAAEVRARVIVAEALHRAGDIAAAHQALRVAVAQLRVLADDAPDPVARAQYLSAVPTNARLVRLAEAWLGEHLG